MLWDRSDNSYTQCRYGKRGRIRPREVYLSDANSRASRVALIGVITRDRRNWMNAWTAKIFGYHVVGRLLSKLTAERRIKMVASRYLRAGKNGTLSLDALEPKSPSFFLSVSSFGSFSPRLSLGLRPIRLASNPPPVPFSRQHNDYLLTW